MIPCSLSIPCESPWEHCTIIELKTLSLPERLMNMTKEEKYLALLPQIHALLAGETDEVARMSNIVAMLNSEFGFWWTGFYRVASSGDSYGPFQGPVACMRIAKGRGVCGTSWNEERTAIVPDVELFPGHIACSSESRRGDRCIPGNVTRSPPSSTWTARI